MKSDIEIAREVSLRKIKEIATGLGIPREEVQNYGRYIAKIPIHLIDEEKIRQHNLILVTAITPTKAGIGKTTVSIGLALGLNKIGKGGRCLARTIIGSMLRHEGRSCRRRILAGVADGKHQPAFYGGFPCGYFCPQYDHGIAGQLHLPDA